MKRDSTRPLCYARPSIHCGLTIVSRSFCAVSASRDEGIFGIEAVASICCRTNIFGTPAARIGAIMQHGDQKCIGECSIVLNI